MVHNGEVLDIEVDKIDSMKMSEKHSCHGDEADDESADYATIDDAVADDDDDKEEEVDEDDDDAVEEDIGDWLDEKSRDAIPAARGTSRLCNACQYMFTEYQPFGRLKLATSEATLCGERSPYCRFLHNLETLKNSAGKGCGFCKLILAIIERDSQEHEPVETLSMKFRIEVLKSDASPEIIGEYNCFDSTRRHEYYRWQFFVNLIHETSQSNSIDQSFFASTNWSRHRHPF